MTNPKEMKDDDQPTSIPSDETPSNQSEQDSIRELTDDELDAVTGGTETHVLNNPLYQG
jgi:bacteriocin-like protein